MENKFIQSVMNKSYTENGALSYATTKSVCVDQFGKAGSYRGRSLEVVFQDQELLWGENPDFAIKFPFYLRMITRKTQIKDNVTNSVQKGQGARDESFKRLLWMAEHKPELFYRNLWLLPIVGCWKDLWVLLFMDKNQVIDKQQVFSIIAEGCISNTQKDLVKKYLPQIRSKKKCTTEWSQITNNLAKDFCNWSGWSFIEYRKFKSTGKAHQFQQYISKGLYDSIEWGKIPGKALLNLTNSKFISNHNLSESYLEWFNSTDSVNFNGYPYELGHKFWCNRGNKIARMTIDAQFDNLIKSAKDDNGGFKSNVWCAIDTSGSMGCRVSNMSDITAEEVAISLGIYFSTLNEGAFHKNVIMFDDTSKVKELKGTFSEMYEGILKGPIAWGSTNFMSVINEIVRVRKYNPNIPLEDFPDTLLIVSDMQFNSYNPSQTNYEAMKDKLYSVFPTDFVDNMKFIWWQVNGARTKDVPATLDNGGCYFFSGFDGSVITLLLSGENQVIDETTGEKRTINMEELIDKTLSQEVLQLIVTK